MRKEGIHAARLEHSPRLQRVHALILKGWVSTLEIQHSAIVCSASTVISELRKNGVQIERRTVGKRPDLIHEYRAV